MKDTQSTDELMEKILTVGDVQGCITEYEQHMNRAIEDKMPPLELLDKYIIEKCISVTSDSDIYIVENRFTHKKYILKIAQVNKYKVNEKLILQELKHISLPEIVDYFSNETYCFIIRTYFEGPTLYDYVRDRGVLSSQEALTIIEGVLDILAYLHSQSPPIIHRDIKPQNIIYTYNREVKLVDFDIARRYSDEGKQDTAYLGTRQYAPPEQFGYSQTDQRTDIYAVGMLLFYILTGHTDVSSIDEAILNKRVKKIIQKCVAFSPNRRYSNTAHLKIAIRCVSHGKPVVKRGIMLSLVTLSLLAVAVYSLLSYAEDKKLAQVPTPQVEVPQVEVSHVPQVKETQGTASQGKISQGTIAQVPTPQEATASNEPTPPDNQVIEIPDQNLEAVIRDAINKLEGPITTDDVASIIELSAKSRGIKSLEGIQHLTNLTSLGLWSNHIEDIGPLKDLINLEQVFLDGNLITDITPLSGLHKIFNLGLGGNRLEDIKPLENLTELRDLNLGNNHISDLEPLVNLRLLEYLHIGEENNITDYSPIQEMVWLKGLEAYGAKDYLDFDVLDNKK